MNQAKFEVPTRGINARSNFDNMHPQDAIRLDNFVAEGGYIRSRGGSVINTNDSDLGGLAGDKPTIATFNGGGEEKLLIAYEDADDHSLYDVSTTPVRLSTGFSNSKWNTMMSNGRMILCNGSDTPQVWDGGATTSDITATLLTGAGDPHPTLNLNDLWGCTMHQTRGYYWAENSQSFFYTDTAGAFQGNLKEFDLSFVIKQGGYLVNVLSQSKDTGGGLDDVAVFVFSTGECVVYEGSDPSTFQDWGLVQTFNIGAPVDIRCNTKWVGNNIILTSSGLVSIDEIMKHGHMIVEQETIWNRIIDLVRRSYTRFRNNEGWDMYFSTSAAFLIINYTRGNGTSRQLVLNTKTGAWSRFVSLNALQWTDFNGELYFSGSSLKPHVMQAEIGTDDDGDYIVTKVIPAFQDYGHPGWKQMTRVGVSTNYVHEIRIDGQKNNHVNNDSAINTPNEYFTSKWNANPWNSFKWGGSTEPLDDEPRMKHYPVHAKGYTLTFKIRAMSRTQQIIYYFFNVQLKSGGNQ